MSGLSVEKYAQHLFRQIEATGVELKDDAEILRCAIRTAVYAAVTARVCFPGAHSDFVKVASRTAEHLVRRYKDLTGDEFSWKELLPR